MASHNLYTVCSLIISSAAKVKLIACVVTELWLQCQIWIFTQQSRIKKEMHSAGKGDGIVWLSFNVILYVSQSNALWCSLEMILTCILYTMQAKTIIYS